MITLSVIIVISTISSFKDTQHLKMKAYSLHIYSNKEFLIHYFKIHKLDTITFIDICLLLRTHYYLRTRHKEKRLANSHSYYFSTAISTEKRSFQNVQRDTFV